MKKEDYSLINDFFNELSLYLFESKDIEENYFRFMILNDSFGRYFKERYFSDGSYQNQTKNNNLTFQEVLDLSKEIIESINPKYIDRFDDLLDSGKLDFSYEHEYDDSHVLHEVIGGKIINQLINVNRKFNYTDVETLVHEFMHYMCYMGVGIRNKIIGEFIAIYFELYADEYMFKKYNMDTEELFYNNRVLTTYANSSINAKVEIPLLLYRTFGNLSKDSYKDATPFFKNYEKKDYDYECDETLKIINNVNTKPLPYLLKSHYYVIATFLAFYFRKKVDISTMINFANNVSVEADNDIDLLDLLEKYNLIVCSDLNSVVIDSIDEYLNLFEKEKKQRN